MTPGRIDVHGHLLPGVDDGCRTLADSLACARALVAAGYTHAFCTPHVWPQLPHNVEPEIARRVTWLQTRFDEAAVPLRLLPGGEINLLWCGPALRQAALRDVVTYNFEGRYALFDFWAAEPRECRECLLPFVDVLQSLGLTVILAHPERIEAFHREPAALDEFTARGVFLQMNTWCLTNPQTSPIFRLAERLLKDGRYFLFGTDLHDPASMPPRIRGIEIAQRLIGGDAVDRLTIHNPRRLFSAEAAADAGAAQFPAVVIGVGARPE
jgi:protein-tyrosine phosphatase